MSVLGLGTVKLGRTAGVKYPKPFDLPDDPQAASLLETAHHLGINFLDTAPAYGISEQRLGELLQGQRDTWIICTKAGEIFDGEKSTYDFSAAGVTASIERSLLRLRTDHLDIALLHADDDDLLLFEHDDGLQALERMREKGLIRAIGVSTKTLEGSLRAVARCDVVMLPLNPVENECAPAIEAAHVANKGVLIKKALVSGHFSAAHSCGDAARNCLEFAQTHRGVSSIVVGTINPEHLKENVQAICTHDSGMPGDTGE